MASKQHGRTVETATEARAGVTGQHVRLVLEISTVAVIVLFALVYLYYFV